jgi:two-component sensor histidine kinase
MLRPLLLSILLCLAMQSYAQLTTDQPASVLIAALHKDNPDSTRLQLLLQLSLKYYFERGDDRENLDTVFTLLQQAEKLHYEIHFTKWKPEILCFLGKYYYKTGNHQQAESYFTNITSHINSLGSIQGRIDRWKELAFNIQEMDTVGLTRVNCFEKMGALYHQLNDKENEIDCDKHIADTHMKQGKLDLAARELLSVLSRLKAIRSPKLCYTYNLLSVTNQLKGNYSKALYYALLTIETMPDSNNAWTIIFYCQAAHLYDELGQPEKSIEYYRIIFKLPPPNPVDFYYVREAGFFVHDLIKQKKFEEARTFLSGFSKKNRPSDPYGRASLARTFAYYYQSAGNYSLADKYHQEMINLFPLLGKNNEIRRDVAYDLGVYYFGKKQFSKSAAQFKTALEEAFLNNSANTIKDIYLMLFKTDSAIGNYLPAIGHLNEFRQLNDSIFNEAKNKQLQEVLAKYETEKKEQNIKLLEKESKLQQSRLVQAANTHNWTLGGMALLLIIAGLLFHNVRTKQRTNKKLEIQQKEIEQQNRSLRHLLNEKDWLLKEIHHRVKNNLQLVMSLLNSQSQYISNEPALTAIHDSQHRVHAMSLIHQKLYGSENVSSIDLSFYIRELSSYLADSFSTGQRIRFEYELEPLEMDVSQAVPLGLILNEAITNAIKYAFPDNRQGLITITLTNTAADEYTLSISDNGVGMTTGFNYKKPSSLGMSLMEGLSGDLDGHFSMENNNGTTIKITFIYDHGIKRPNPLMETFAITN